ncbi:protein naked cuticle homolog 1-like [Uloborus diversus]|uniref:protein naked cuticle homolog 1-like n=1 Tax=Uloborus diversus TaxID=327109 RepID=UPI00240A022C|nr:protein naked cuticle homolog 1-like [Uloborus diversus]
MSSILGKIPKFTLKLPSALAKAGRTMSECPLELSFSLCDESSCAKNKTEEQIPLQVKLPQDSEKPDPLYENRETLEKADEEKSEKQDNMEVTCSVSIDGQEKQEFSFTLYDFDTCDKANKQDVEKVVVRSICDALNKTLKIPPSGSRTIKVKLAISPDSSKDVDTKDPTAEPEWPAEPPKIPAPSKMNDCCSAQSANTTSTYLPSSHSEKPPKYSSPSATRSPQLVRMSTSDVRAMPSPKMRAARLNRHKHELKNSLRERIAMQMNASDNRHKQADIAQSVPEDHQHHKHPTNRDHVPECRDRRNHYLDLAGIESPKHDASQTKPTMDASYSHRMDPKYICPYRILDRTHVCSKSHRTRDNHSTPVKKPSYPKQNVEGEGTPRMYRTKINPDPQDDLLNLNFDLCDLDPDAKFDWERPQHRRSKSYDLYENDLTNPGGLYSPKLKPRNNPNWSSILESQKLSNHLPSSPGHHYRHRHRDKEKERAMQQVANWIAREHFNSKSESNKRFSSNSVSPKSAQGPLVERHEHHHLHEHVHHHYHHFVEF